MAKKSKSTKIHNEINESPKHFDTTLASSEYSLEQVLVPKHSDLEKAKEMSSYRFTHDQLEHKADHIDADSD